MICVAMRHVWDGVPHPKNKLLPARLGSNEDAPAPKMASHPRGLCQAAGAKWCAPDAQGVPSTVTLAHRTAQPLPSILCKDTQSTCWGGYSGYQAPCSLKRDSGYQAPCSLKRDSGYQAPCSLKRDSGYQAPCSLIRGSGYQAPCSLIREEDKVCAKQKGTESAYLPLLMHRHI